MLDEITSSNIIFKILEDISDEEFFINKNNGGNTANSNSNSGGQQLQQQVTRDRGSTMKSSKFESQPDTAL